MRHHDTLTKGDQQKSQPLRVTERKAEQDMEVIVIIRSEYPS